MSLFHGSSVPIICLRPVNYSYGIKTISLAVLVHFFFFLFFLNDQAEKKSRLLAKENFLIALRR